MGTKKERDGSTPPDLIMSLDMGRPKDGRRAAGFVISKELAERAQIRLTTHTKDGKTDASERLHHVIPVAQYLKGGPARAAAPAAERDKD